MNILYIANPASIHDCKWINYFASENHVVVVCSPLYGKKSYLDKIVKVFEVLPDYYPLRNIFLRNKTISAIKAVIHEENIKIIHAMYAVPNAFWAYYLDSYEYVLTTRGSDVLVEFRRTNDIKKPRELIVNYFLSRLLIKCLERAKLITATSVRQIEEIKRMASVSDAKISLVRTGIDIDSWVPIKSDGKPNDSIKFNIVCPRNIAPIYNIELIVDACKILIQSAPDFNFQLYLIKNNGYKDYFDMIVNRIETSGLKSHCTIKEFMDQNEMIELYSRSNLIVSVPLSDGTPNSVLEAMLMMKPVIVNDLKYDIDIFNENTVWQLKSSSANELAEMILHISHLDKNSLMDKLIYSKECVVKHASLKIELQKITSLYNNMNN